MVPTVQELDFEPRLSPLSSFSDETPILISFIHSQREFFVGANKQPGRGWMSDWWEDRGPLTRNKEREQGSETMVHSFILACPFLGPLHHT